MQLDIQEFRYLPKYIQCPVCHKMRRSTVQRIIEIEHISYCLETCSPRCDAALMTHLLQTYINSQYAFERQETHMLPVMSKQKELHTDAAPRLVR